MQASDRPRFAELIKDAMAFYRREVTPFVLNVWWQACSSYDFEQVSKAITAHAMNPEGGQFAPMPADIVKHLSGTSTDRSLVAWTKLLDTVQRVGRYASVVFDDPIIHAIVEDLGGWVKVCSNELSDLPHEQRRFTEAYRSYVRRESFAYPPRLVGIHEADNAVRGQVGQDPELIGDPAKALAVMRSGVQGSRTQVTPLASVQHLLKGMPQAPQLREVRRVG